MRTTPFGKRGPKTLLSAEELVRLMREHGLLAPRRIGSPWGSRNHEGTIIPEAPDLMWGTDFTAT